ncbi:hypothetical protein EON65_11575 [archaeon]|nr:MAG: hypothetical protein EON65_11575 [archaeon]
MYCADGESIYSGQPDNVNTEQSEHEKANEDQSQDGDAIEMVDHAAIKALITLNYIDVLIRTQSFTNLRNCMPAKEFMLKCVACMGSKEKDKLLKSVVPAYRGIQVLHTSLKHELLLQALIQEVALITSNLELLHLLPSTSSLADELSQALSRQSKEKSIVEEDDQSLSSAQTKTSAQLRKEKRQKYQEQRNKDNKVRQDVSRQRKILYDLVHTDKISEIFASKARAGAASIKTLWGGDSDGAELEKDQALFDEMANAMANQHLEVQAASNAMGSSVGSPSSVSGSASTLSRPSTLKDR